MNSFWPLRGRQSVEALASETDASQDRFTRLNRRGSGMKWSASILAAMLWLLASSAALAQGTHYVIGLPYVYARDSGPIFKNIALIALRHLKPGDKLDIYDGVARKRIARLSVPAGKAYQHPKVRVRHFARPLRALRAYLKTIEGRVSPTITEQVHAPQFLAELSNTVLAGREKGSDVRVLLIGDGRHIDNRTKSLNMTFSGVYPSDGHLKVSSAESIYGTSDKIDALAGVRVHWLLPEQPIHWSSDAHFKRVRRFWSLFVKQQNGSLISFSGDVPVVFERFMNPNARPRKTFTLDHAAKSVRMVKLVTGSKVKVGAKPGDFLQEDVTITTTPPAEFFGASRIGIRWLCQPCDVDLYARTGSVSWLYFGNTVTDDGRYHKDFTTAPAEKGYEFIDLHRAVDIRSIQARVKFYGGPEGAVAKGELRLFFKGRVYAAPFTVSKDKPEAVINMEAVLNLEKS